jgi:hypothetical protein
MPTRPARPRRVRLPSSPQEWTRRKLQALLVVAFVTAMALAYGAITSLVSLLHDDPPTAMPPPTSDQESSQTSRKDQLAAAPLPTASLADAQPGPLSTDAAASLELPASTGVGPAGAASGFPRTPEGALAQLIAIDRAAIEPAVVSRAQDVIAGWSTPGGPTTRTWSGVSAVAALLSAAGFPATGAPEMQIRLDPAMGLIKGTVGEGFVIPCVDFVVTATTTASGTQRIHRVAVADCQRMVWQGDRWVIGAGPEPAPPPSVWPGTPASLAAGYQWLEAPAWTE